MAYLPVAVRVTDIVVLSKVNIVAEESKGALYGKAYSGVIYSAMDNDGDNCRQTESNRVHSNCRGAKSRKGSQSLNVGSPFPATAIGDFAGAKALGKKYLASKTVMEKGAMVSALRGKIDKAFIGVTTLGQLRDKLFDNGVGVVFRENAEGRLYGITYIDHTSGATLNGSRLGKNYSANMVVERLQNSHVQSVLQPTLHSSRPVQEREQVQAPLPPPQQDLPREHDQSGSFTSSGLGLFDPLPADHNPEAEEDAFRKWMQQQQKKKRGRRM